MSKASDGIAYLLDRSNGLHSWDLATDTLTTIGTANVDLADLAVAPDGTLFGVSSDALFEVDASTAQATQIGASFPDTQVDASVTGATAFDISSSGAARIGVGSVESIFAVDLTTGVLTDIGSASDPNGIGTNDIWFVDADRYAVSTNGGRLVLQQADASGIEGTVSGQDLDERLVNGLIGAPQNGFGIAPGTIIGFAGTEAFQLGPTDTAASGTGFKTLAVPDTITGAAISPNPGPTPAFLPGETPPPPPPPPITPESLAQGGLAYLIDSTQTLHSWDLATDTLTTIGTSGVALRDLAIAPDGVLYGVSSGALFRVDASDASTVKLADVAAADAGGFPTGLGANITGFGISSSGEARLGLGSPRNLPKIDLTTGAITDTGPVESPTTGELTWLGTGDIWHTGASALAVSTSGRDQPLVALTGGTSPAQIAGQQDISEGEPIATVEGLFGAPANMFGLPEGSLIGLSGTQAFSLAPGGSAVPGSAFATLSLPGSVPGSVLGAAINPASVPAPPAPAAAPALPTLAERMAVDTGAVNGLFSEAALTATLVQNARISRLDDLTEAANDNALGAYVIGSDGAISGVRMLFDNSTAAAEAGAVLQLTPGQSLGLFLVTDGADWAAGLAETDTLSFVDAASGSPGSLAAEAPLQLLVNGDFSGQVAFHASGGQFNSDGAAHVLSGALSGQDGVVLGFEDQLGGGDRDFQDMVVSVIL